MIRRRDLLIAGTALLCLLPSRAIPALAQTSQTQTFPDVRAAKVTPRGNDVFDFDVTISSPYDTAQRYANGFRVVGPDGKLLGERKLWHDHADEQPFTRDLHGVRIPADLRSVRIEARDQKFGYGGKSIEVVLPGR